MLLVEKFFSSFTSKTITDTSKSTEVLMRLLQQQDAGRQLVVSARRRRRCAPQDHGFMYSRL
jgi:predicted lactoylglutathione lyase